MSNTPMVTWAPLVAPCPVLVVSGKVQKPFLRRAWRLGASESQGWPSGSCPRNEGFILSCWESYQKASNCQPSFSSRRLQHPQFSLFSSSSQYPIINQHSGCEDSPSSAWSGRLQWTVLQQELPMGLPEAFVRIAVLPLGSPVPNPASFNSLQVWIPPAYPNKTLPWTSLSKPDSCGT